MSDTLNRNNQLYLPFKLSKSDSFLEFQKWAGKAMPLKIKNGRLGPKFQPKKKLDCHDKREFELD